MVSSEGPASYRLAGVGPTDGGGLDSRRLHQGFTAQGAGFHSRPAILCPNCDHKEAKSRPVWVRGV